MNRVQPFGRRLTFDSTHNHPQVDSSWVLHWRRVRLGCRVRDRGEEILWFV